MGVVNNSRRTLRWLTLTSTGVKVVGNSSPEDTGVIEDDLLVGAEFVTGDFFRVPIQNTLLETQRKLARRVAQAGCDLLVVDDREWITFRGPPGDNEGWLYIRVKWGRQRAGDSSLPQQSVSGVDERKVAVR